MNWKLKICLLAGCAGLLLNVAALPEGFVPLFNGKDLTGWWGLKTEDPAKWMALPPEKFEEKKQASLKDIHQHWRVEGDVLVNDGKGLFLTTDKNYADFELMLEYKTVARADSGVYLRGIPQVQIWDSTDKKKFKLGADKGSGGLWNNKKNLEGRDPLVLADQPFGEWNQMRILMVGERVSVLLNDQIVVDHARLENYFNRDMPVPRSGPIQLQTHGGEISWRNVFIREIGGEEANQILVFNAWEDGEVPADWQGPADNYLFENGMIQCKKGKGGTIFTETEYSDFAVQFEFKLPEGGNNGLAIRYPGKGNPAYNGMCELQVLDNTAPKYAKLDQRQYHGSAYGMMPAHRGYQRPVGEWNFQTVEVVGSTIKVELNGTLILDADLSGVTEYLADKKHPGKELTRGHFGFAGHNSPVAFRNILIKELNHESK
ncbi:3-keto-disaccharide hydrolase [Pontiella sulfatireligans]|uniref:3-keto-alpha-glucoside-1,2-lyase/3-keto-2-hydroxy-glucal hydratase domain-containing protein n=1 Tax=Pontiella sulfatireligans TaxID=2750658 RepID=A0A6C2UM43_9BACT|nr:DUF1080 domain-containing protein [Pontiella sulfatireligans]VGO20497.1 hypothetical protein SCARR_02560 [Pontiella sulfatireligans]